MEKNKERLEVIENIKKNIKEGNLNKKVEVSDHVLSEKDKKYVEKKVDNFRKNPIAGIKRKICIKLIQKFINAFNKDTNIYGIENVEKLKNKGAIITSNHFAPQDSTPIRYMTNKIGMTKKLDTVISDENIFHPRKDFRFILRYANTITLSRREKYMATIFFPAVEKLLKKGHWVLIYPEEEMWFNYKKPRPGMIGAYHLASKYNVPIIPCFVEQIETAEYDENGFHKAKYNLYIEKPIYPDRKKSMKDRKEELQTKDYQTKVAMYEKIYKKKLDYKFEEIDITGFID